MSKMSKQFHAAGQIPEVSAFPTPTPEDVKAAAEVLWGKQVDAATADAVGSDSKCKAIMTQLIEGWPAPAAITFAMAYGYMLRVQIEKQSATRLLT